jgi:DnaK suppressor protein
MSLTPQQRRVVERRLQEERERALRTLNRTVAESAGDTEQDRSGDLTSVPFHPADLGTDTMQAELDASNVTRTSREFAEIEAALERLYARPDRFGICEDTGQQIPFERLEIIPWARTCLEAER